MELAMNPRSLSREIHEIASQTGTPEDEVKRLYDDALQSLAAAAQVQDYLLLLASKRVRQHLKDWRRAQQGDSSE
jgi:hypothetical protein